MDKKEKGKIPKRGAKKDPPNGGSLTGSILLSELLHDPGHPAAQNIFSQAGLKTQDPVNKHADSYRQAAE